MSLLNKDLAAKPVAEKPEPKSHGSGSSSGTYYKIEVRSWHIPRILADRENPRTPFVIDKDWKEWHISLTYGDGPAPSMPCGYFERHPAEHGLMSYNAAMGHLWGMYAFLAANHMDLCVQARLVACKYQESWSVTEESVSDVIMPPRLPCDAFMPRADSDAKALKQEN